MEETKALQDWLGRMYGRPASAMVDILSPHRAEGKRFVKKKW